MLTMPQITSCGRTERGAVARKGFADFIKHTCPLREYRTNLWITIVHHRCGSVRRVNHLFQTQNIGCKFRQKCQHSVVWPSTPRVEKSNTHKRLVDAYAQRRKRYGLWFG